VAWSSQNHFAVDGPLSKTQTVTCHLHPAEATPTATAAAAKVAARTSTSPRRSSSDRDQKDGGDGVAYKDASARQEPPPAPGDYITCRTPAAQGTSSIRVLR
jgi:hypothetical protein